MSGRLGLFEGYGVELEYMLVDAETLDVRPAADRLIAAQAGEVVSEVEVGPINWSNELVLHVVELKTSGPAPALPPLVERFQDNVGRIGSLLAPMGMRLLPTAMHPWMDPATETVLWPHEHSAIYEAYDRIFSCQGHGWSNLQSAHLNLPFADDEEFGRLHAGIRLVLPLLPALAASSPLADGRLQPFRDYRMEVYRTNSARIPEVAGRVVPERAFSEAEYRELVFAPMMRAMAPHDPAGILEEEFLNSRGAIARFGRGSIEIRVVDVQECPRADLAIVAATVAVLRGLVEERWVDSASQRSFETGRLAAVMRATTRDAEDAEIDPDLARALGRREARTAGEVWRSLIEGAAARGALDPVFEPALEHLLGRGTLATRIARAVGKSPDRTRLVAVYRELADCLAAGRLFG